MLDNDAKRSRDQAFAGLVTVEQYRQGYRFSIDALWLVATARVYAKGLVVDMGAGCGIVGLSLAQLEPVRQVFMVERQARLARLAAHNIALNQLDIPVRCLQQDLRTLQKAQLPQAAHLVVFNPPFFDPQKTRPSRDPEQNAARRSLAGALEDFISAAVRIMRADGRCVFVFPAQHIDRVRRALGQNKLCLQALRYIYKNHDSAARLLVAVAGLDMRRDCEILSPCYEFDDLGHESPQARALRAQGP